MTTFQPPDYVKCPACGWLHFEISAATARAEVAEVNAHLRAVGEPENASFDRYLRCFRCGADTAGFVPAQESDAPLGCTIQPAVVER